MIIEDLKPIDTKLNQLQEIPDTFFEQVDHFDVFGADLFPEWFEEVFGRTSLSKKFEVLFDAYKAMHPKQRTIVKQQYEQLKDILCVCHKEEEVEVIDVHQFPENVREAVEKLFSFLYSSSLRYDKFSDHINDDVSSAIRRFAITTNRIEVCPICGIESFYQLEGQADEDLDHWLCQDLFPFASINFNNLIPLGRKCNGRPAKGNRNILFDNFKRTGKRIKAYHPYAQHHGVTIIFSFDKEPSIDGITEKDWKLQIVPNHEDEQEYLESWKAVFNIDKRYNSYMTNYVLGCWEDNYFDFIQKNEELNHADSIDEFKRNIKRFRGQYPIKGRPGSIIYQSFLNYLIEGASEAYLYSLYENFKSRATTLAQRA